MLIAGHYSAGCDANLMSFLDFKIKVFVCHQVFVFLHFYFILQKKTIFEE